MSAQIHSINPREPNVITVLVDPVTDVVSIRVDGKPMCSITNQIITWSPESNIPGLDARMRVMMHAWDAYVRRDAYEDFSYTVDIFHDILCVG